MYNLKVNGYQVQAIDWALTVAANTVSAQIGEVIPHKEAHEMVKGLTAVGELIETQIRIQDKRQSSSNASEWEQVGLF